MRCGHVPTTPQINRVQSKRPRLKRPPIVALLSTRPQALQVSAVLSGPHRLHSISQLSTHVSAAYREKEDAKLMAVSLSFMPLTVTLISYYYQFFITHSLFHSRLKTFFFCKSFPLQPLFFFFRTDYMIPQTFTVTCNISAFTFQFFCFTIFSCRLRAVD